MNRSTALRLAQIGLLWVGFGLALRLLDRFALREDEAIYSYWARHFWHVDPYFLTVWPDKPPLFLWLLAGVFQLWGASQASGRLLNIMLTLLTAVVVGATARRLWGQPSGLVATTLYLLNPFALSFAPTVYTDPLLVLVGQLALYCAITGRGLGAGLWLAAAIMTKQQGVLYAPLILGALWLRPGARQIAQPIRLWLSFFLGVFSVVAPIVYWDSTRWAVAPSPWDLSVRTYGGLQWATLQEWLPRAHEWAKLLWYLTASWLVWLILVGIIIAALCSYPRQSDNRSKDFSLSPAQTKTKVFTTDGALMRWLALWCSAFLVVHIITTIQIWDRYLLPLTPLLCLLVSWVFAQIRRCGLQPHGSLWLVRLQTAPTNHQARPSWWQASSQGCGVVGIVSLLFLVPPALAATNGKLPLGGDHGDYNGLTAAITRLREEAPDDVILYHQRLGWHYQFYLFDEVATGAYDLRWFPTPIYLAANAAQSPNRPRFLVLPDWGPQPALARHLATRRLHLLPVAHSERMTLYRIENQRQTGCDWCRCQGHSPWPVWPNLNLSGEFVQP